MFFGKAFRQSRQMFTVGEDQGLVFFFECGVVVGNEELVAAVQADNACLFGKVKVGNSSLVVIGYFHHDAASFPLDQGG